MKALEEVKIKYSVYLTPVVMTTREVSSVFSSSDATKDSSRSSWRLLVSLSVCWSLLVSAGLLVSLSLCWSLLVSAGLS